MHIMSYTDMVGLQPISRIAHACHVMFRLPTKGPIFHPPISLQIALYYPHNNTQSILLNGNLKKFFAYYLSEIVSHLSYRHVGIVLCIRSIIFTSVKLSFF